MHASNRQRRSGLILGLLMLAVFCSGCLKGDIFEYVAYDPASDTFRFLQLDMNITAEKPADLDHLAELWKQRDQIIVHPTLIRIFGLPAILRVDASHYKTIDLAQTIDEKPAEATAVPLDAIKNKPGKFVLSTDGTLCYFHAVEVSGPIVDQVLAVQNKELNQTIGEEIDNELKRRADGGKLCTWDDLRKEIEESYRTDAKDGANAGKMPPAPKKDDDKAEGWPGSADSLKILSKAVTAREIAIRRHAAEFSIAVPLSPEDCRQAKATLDLGWKLAVERAKKQSQAGVAELIPDVHIDIVDGNKLVLKVDLKHFMEFNAKSLAAAKPDPKLTAQYRDAVAALRRREIPIDEKLTPQQVVDEFRGKP